MRRALVPLLSLLLVFGIVPVAAAEQTVAELNAENDFYELINTDRAAEGLEPLAVYGDLIDDARAQSEFQAADLCPEGARICHNDDLASVTTNWTRLGENVGVGGSSEEGIVQLHQAFMDSPGHYANIMGDYNYIGVGVVIREDGALYVTVVFMLGPEGLESELPNSPEPAGPNSEGVPIFPGEADRIGQHNPNAGTWELAGNPEPFYYGNPADIPMACDWDQDGESTVGLYRGSSGFLYLRQTNTFGVADVSIFYGIPEDLPLCGDWDGDGRETVGIYRPSEARFYLRNSNTQGFADLALDFGDFGDVPLAGDWNGDGTHTIAVFRPSDRTLYIQEGSDAGSYDRPDIQEGDKLVVGDWNDDGRDTLGYFRPSTGKFHYSDWLVDSAPDSFYLGNETHSPVVGRW